MKVVLALLVSLLSLTALAASPGGQRHYGRFYVSGEPTAPELEDFRRQAGGMVIDLRNFDELGDCHQPAAVMQAGMQYGRTNFDGHKPITEDVIRSIDEQVDQAKDKPVLLFCKTGSRALAWLTIHLVKKENMTPEQAFKITKGLGMNGKMEKATRAYLEQN